MSSLGEFDFLESKLFATLEAAAFPFPEKMLVEPESLVLLVVVVPWLSDRSDVTDFESAVTSDMISLLPPSRSARLFCLIFANAACRAAGLPSLANSLSMALSLTIWVSFAQETLSIARKCIFITDKRLRVSSSNLKVFTVFFDTIGGGDLPCISAENVAQSCFQVKKLLGENGYWIRYDTNAA